MTNKATGLSDIRGPRTFNICGHDLELEPLPLQRLAQLLETRLKEVYRRSALEDANAFQLMGQERVAYLSEAMKKMPSGADMQRESLTSIGTFEGISYIVALAMKDQHPKVEYDETKIIQVDALDETLELVSFLMGMADFELPKNLTAPMPT